MVLATVDPKAKESRVLFTQRDADQSFITRATVSDAMGSSSSLGMETKAPRELSLELGLEEQSH